METAHNLDTLRMLLEPVIRALLESLPEPPSKRVRTIRYEERGAVLPEEMRPHWALAIESLQLRADEITQTPEFQALVAHVRGVAP